MRIFSLGRSRFTRRPTVGLIATVAMVVRRSCLRTLDSFGGPGESFFIRNKQSLPDGVGRKHGMSNLKVANIDDKYL